MTPFKRLTSIAVPVLRDNIDTDTIIPSREMKTTGRTGLADGLFAPWRYRGADGRTADPTFALNDERAKGVTILLAGVNFGCGSSREHAVWALLEYGIRCVIAPSFAPIFKANCLRNGLLPVAIEKDATQAMQWQNVTASLIDQEVTCGELIHNFEIDPEAKTMMLEGLDAIDLTLKDLPAIERWTNTDRGERPWAYLGARK